MPAAPMPDATPRRVGRYELLLPIASGGMATVYLARTFGTGGFQREVALKLTHPHFREQPEWSSELIEEAKLASRIRHPNVVSVLDVDDDPGGVFLVMEYVPGDTLAGLVRREMGTGGVIPLSIAGTVLREALDGLHAAHELTDDAGKLCEVVHRDFSPQNLIVGIDGVTRLTDFGVAKAVDRVGFTRTGAIKGKFAYMSPQQIMDEPLDRRADVWAAGVVAWELVTGKRLHPSSEQPSVLLSIVQELSPPASLIRPSLPEPISRVIERALVLDVDGRWASARAFRDALTTAFEEAGVGFAPRHEVSRYVEGAVHDLLSDRAERVRQVTQSSRGGAAAGSLAVEEAKPSEATHVVEVVPNEKRRSFGVRSLVGTALVCVVVVGGVALGANRRRATEATATRAHDDPAATAAASSPPAPHPEKAAAVQSVAPVPPAPPSAVRAVSSSAARAAPRVPTRPTTASRPTSVPSATEPTMPPLRPNPYDRPGAP